MVRFYYRILTGKSGEHVLLDNHPQGAFDLIFVVSEGMEVKNDRSATQIQSGILLIGQQQGVFSVRFPANSVLYVIVFEPEAFGRLFQMDLKELKASGENIQGDLPPAARILPERLSDAGEIEWVQLLEEFVFGEIARQARGEDSVDRIIRYIRTQPGPVRIPDIADEAAMSVRTLQRKLRNRLGVSPKTFTRIFRFNQLLAQMKLDGGQNWQDAMHQLGYYDQAHLIKDFKQFTGRSPGRFFQEDKTLSDFFQGINENQRP